MTRTASQKLKRKMAKEGQIKTIKNLAFVDGNRFVEIWAINFKLKFMLYKINGGMFIKYFKDINYIEINGTRIIL